MTFRTFTRLALFSFLAGLVMAAEPISQSKNSQLIKLLHYSGAMKYFREVIVSSIDAMRKDFERPASFWEDVERNVNMNEYSGWWVSIVNERLSENELIDLNAVWSSKQKMEVLDELGRISTSKKGQNHDDDLKALRDSKGAKVVDEVLVFVGTETYRKYIGVLDTLQAGERDITIKLLDEASKRVTAKYNAQR